METDRLDRVEAGGIVLFVAGGDGVEGDVELLQDRPALRRGGGEKKAHVLQDTTLRHAGAFATLADSSRLPVLS
jgi:hypothetical protein